MWTLSEFKTHSGKFIDLSSKIQCSGSYLLAEAFVLVSILTTIISLLFGRYCHINGTMHVFVRKIAVLFICSKQIDISSSNSNSEVTKLIGSQNQYPSCSFRSDLIWNVRSQSRGDTLRYCVQLCWCLLNKFLETNIQRQSDGNISKWFYEENEPSWGWYIWRILTKQKLH